MSIIEQFQKLDELICENTTPPVQGILRHQLSLTREQIEAYQAQSDKQDETLGKQLETISALQSRYDELVAKQAQLDGDSRKVGATLKSGAKQMYDADFYVILPHKNNPQLVEFRKSNHANHTYEVTGSVKWADVSTLHGCDYPKPPELEPAAKAILKLLFDHGDDLTARLIQNRVGLKPGVFDHHLDGLLQSKFVRQSRVGSDSGSCWYEITREGRGFAMKMKP